MTEAGRAATAVVSAPARWQDDTERRVFLNPARTSPHPPTHGP